MQDAPEKHSGKHAFYKHKILEKQSANIADCTFKLRVIDVPCLGGKYYVNFLEIPDELEACFVSRSGKVWERGHADGQELVRIEPA